MKYAFLKGRADASCLNLGDEIQFYAMKYILRKMDIPDGQICRITDAEFLRYTGDEYLIVLVNNIFMGEYERLSPHILPVYLGISLQDKAQIVPLRLKEFEPIGCRDYFTFKLLTENGIRAYLNGCMTLTLPRRDRDIVGKDVYAIDICDEVYGHIPNELKKNMIIGNHIKWGGDAEGFENIALSAYEEYKRNAKLVITSRLHCIVPCIAFGIPVIYAAPYVPTRMDWLNRLIPLYDKEHFDEIDWNPSPIDVEDLKEKLLLNAMKRIKDTEDKYQSICEISEFYETGYYKNCIDEDLISTMHYTRENWKDDDKSYKYIIWGATATARRVKAYIEENFPKARLIGLIDVFRTVDIEGVKSEGIEILDSIDENTTVFVATHRAHKMAMAEFSKRNIKKFVICYDNHNDKKLQEMIKNV